MEAVISTLTYIQKSMCKNGTNLHQMMLRETKKSADGADVGS